MTGTGDHRDVLSAAVSAIGGQPRPGQELMADAIAASFESGVHLLVQAGTGTGKSLGYLAPALTHLVQSHEPIVIATATLALQSQLASKDIPAALDAMEKVSGKRPTFAVLKGRTNYACLLRVREGAGPDQEALIESAQVLDAARSSGLTADSAVGAEVVALREWAERELVDAGVADRDDAPTHTPRAWAQVSVPVRECIGVQKCPYGQQCFVELSREHARKADLVVTNHALLAIDAMHGGTALPEHGIVIVDEAHELVSRVTGAASAELSPQIVDRVARRARPWLSARVADEFEESADLLAEALAASEPAQIKVPEVPAVAGFELVRAVSRRALDELGDKSAKADVERTQAAAAVKEVFDVAERMAALVPADVVWVSERERFGRQAVVAPLSVAGLMRDRVFGQSTTILTSATLMVGGSFDTVARSVGLQIDERIDDHPTAGQGGDDAPVFVWRGIDVGSPFDYGKQGILYIAAGLPSPGRDGISAEALAEIGELVRAAGGRTLGLFASQRNALAAAEFVRRELPTHTVLCQGDAQLSELTRRFVAEPDTCLFGTLSLWQGVDVPGDTCQLVIIDKIPFPRPDDPLMQARQQAVAQAGGNGFMSVAAAHAGLLLAQGSGRLVRRLDDRGVVAVLDPRLIKARYGSFLRASMPDFWTTTDREVAIGSLRRLTAARTPPG